MGMEHSLIWISDVLFSPILTYHPTWGFESTMAWVIVCLSYKRKNMIDKWLWWSCKLYWLYSCNRRAHSAWWRRIANGPLKDVILLVGMGHMPMTNSTKQFFGFKAEWSKSPEAEGEEVKRVWDVGSGMPISLALFLIETGTSSIPLTHVGRRNADNVANTMSIIAPSAQENVCCLVRLKPRLETRASSHSKLKCGSSTMLWTPACCRIEPRVHCTKR